MKKKINLPKGFWIKEYIINRKSSLVLAKELNVCKATILKELNGFGIKRRTRSEIRDLRIGVTWEKMHGKEKAKEMKIKQSKFMTGRSISTKGKTYEEIYGKETAKRLKDIRREKFIGQIPWNKGLTKETDKRLRKLSENLNGRKSKRKIKLDLNLIKKLYLSEERSPEEIGKIMNVSRKTICKRLEEMNVPLREKINKRSIEKIKRSIKKLWKDEDYRKKNLTEENIKKRLNGLLKRPTSYEKKISELCIENNLPFIYTGNGTFLIGYKNPDFIHKTEKIAIEVYHNYFKIRDFGSCEEYEKQRAEHFAKYGYKTIFIRTEHMEDKNWKKICLNKIKNGK